MEIKRIPKEIIEEGITIEMINSPLFDKKISPAILRHGEEAVKLLCINKQEKERRYWAIDNAGNYIKDGNNLFVVFEKEARIGRARFLLLHGEEEKMQERERFYMRVDEQCEKWKNEIDKKMTELYFELQVKKCLAGEKYEEVPNLFLNVSTYVSMMKQNQDDFQLKALKDNAKAVWSEFEDLYDELVKSQQEGDYYRLIKLFGKIPSGHTKPLLTAHFENPVEMENFKKIFGKDAIEHFAGDMFKISAAIYLTKTQQL